MFPASDYYKLNTTAITYQKKGLGGRGRQYDLLDPN